MLFSQAPSTRRAPGWLPVTAIRCGEHTADRHGVAGGHVTYIVGLGQHGRRVWRGNSGIAGMAQTGARFGLDRPAIRAKRERYSSSEAGAAVIGRPKCPRNCPIAERPEVTTSQMVVEDPDIRRDTRQHIGTGPLHASSEGVAMQHNPVHRFSLQFQGRRRNVPFLALAAASA
jgi:hypothetical protein